MLSAEEYRKLRKTKKKNKFGAKKSGGYDSKWEQNFAQQLQLLEKAKLISDLQEKQSYDLIASGVVIGTIEPDFEYDEGSVRVMHEAKCKATETPLWRWKWKHFKAQYPQFEFRVSYEDGTMKGQRKPARPKKRPGQRPEPSLIESIARGRLKRR